MRRWSNRRVEFEPGRLPRGRNQIVHHVGADTVPVIVERDPLHAGCGEPLSEAPRDLPFNDHRVDTHSTIINSDHSIDLPHAGLGVDLNNNHIAPERIGQVRWVVVVDTFKARLHPLGEIGVRGERNVLDGHTLVGCTLHEKLARLPLEVVFRCLEEVRGEFPGLLTQLPSDDCCRSSRDRSASRAIRAKPVRCVVGIPFDHRDVRRRDAKLVGDDLRERRLVALTLALHTKLEDRLARRMDAQLGRIDHLESNDVVVAAGSSTDRFGEAGDADADVAALLSCLGLFLTKVLVVNRIERLLKRRVVVTRVVHETCRGVVGKLLRFDEVLHPELGWIHIELIRGILDKPLDQIRRLRDPEGAPIGNATRCLVRIGAICHDMRRREVI